jgi:CBS domain containing-hemolysin-like protein
VNEELKVNLPDNDAYETLAGLILYRLQHIPKVGEHLTLDKVQLTIKEMMGAKIEKVEVKRVDTTLPVSAEAASNGADVKGES